METISNEIISEIALNLPIEDLIKFCRTSLAFSNFCNDEWFWQQRFKRDYPNIYLSIPTELLSLTLDEIMSEGEH